MIRRRDISVVELVDAHLEAIHRHQSALNALVSIDDDGARSANPVQVYVYVSKVNDAPTLSTNASLYQINEDVATPVFPPYAGRVTRVLAKAGDVVKAGQALFFIEATDMVQAQNDLIAAIARLRGKLKYRPVVFELMPGEFTLTELQRTVEAISGRHVHKQNFRRLVETAAMVEATGETSTATGGRPAALFRFRREVMQERPAPGLRVGGRSS